MATGTINGTHLLVLLVTPVLFPQGKASAMKKGFQTFTLVPTCWNDLVLELPIFWTINLIFSPATQTSAVS